MVKTRIKEARAKEKLTQKVAAKKMGGSQQQWHQWETGERLPSYRSLLRIAKVLKVEVKDLV